MRAKLSVLATGLLLVAGASVASPAQDQSPVADSDPIRILVGRLDLAQYKATLQGLTKFGDRRQGTQRNRSAVDWIEAQLRSYGCTNTERIAYMFPPGSAPERRRGR